MTTFSNLLESLEKLAFETLMWVVFIPKTLFKVFWNPFWVPNYIEGELKKAESKFSDYVSPIILFSLILVTLIGLNQNISKIYTAKMIAPDTSKVGETSTFYAEPSFLWGYSYNLNTYYAGEVWRIRTENYNDIYRLIRYNEYDSENYVNHSKFIEEQSSNINGANATIDIEKINFEQRYPSKFTYSWENSGVYIVEVFYYNYSGEISSSRSKIYVSNNGQIFQPEPDLNSENNFLQAALSPSNSSISVFENPNLATFIVLVFLLIPLILSLLSHLVQGGKLTRQDLQLHFYVHVMYLSPVVLAYLFYQIASSYKVNDFNWLSGEESAFIVSRIHDILSQYLYYLSLVWFAVVDIRFSLRKIDSSFLVTSAVTAMCFLAMYYFSMVFRPISGFGKVIFQPIGFEYGLPQILFGIYFLATILLPVYVLMYKNSSRLKRLIIIFYETISNKLKNLLSSLKRKRM